MSYERILFFRIVTMPELSPRQGPPEVDVLPVASIAVAAAVVAVVVTHYRLALQLAHHQSTTAPPRLLGIPEVAPALGPKAAEPGGAVPRIVRM